MSKKLYALTDEQVEVIDGWAFCERRTSTDENAIFAAGQISKDLHTPLDRDAAVERMARSLAESLYGGDFWDDYEDDGITLTVNRESYRSDARAAFDALLQEDE